jgi:hypothetical protein
MKFTSFSILFCVFLWILLINYLLIYFALDFLSRYFLSDQTLTFENAFTLTTEHHHHKTYNVNFNTLQFMIIDTPDLKNLLIFIFSSTRHKSSNPSEWKNHTNELSFFASNVSKHNIVSSRLVCKISFACALDGHEQEERIFGKVKKKFSSFKWK